MACNAPTVMSIKLATNESVEMCRVRPRSICSRPQRECVGHEHQDRRDALVAQLGRRVWDRIRQHLQRRERLCWCRRRTFVPVVEEVGQLRDDAQELTTSSSVELAREREHERAHHVGDVLRETVRGASHRASLARSASMLSL